MNPTRWKWYTWVALLYFVGVFYVNFNGVPAEGIISAIVGAIAWLILRLIDWVVRALYREGKTPPPTGS